MVHVRVLLVLGKQEKCVLGICWSGGKEALSLAYGYGYGYNRA